MIFMPWLPRSTYTALHPIPHSKDDDTPDRGPSVEETAEEQPAKVQPPWPAGIDPHTSWIQSMSEWVTENA